MKTDHPTSAEQLSEDLHHLVEDGEELLRSGAQRLNEQAHARLSETIEAAKVTGAKLKARALESARSTDETIREHPYQFLGVAFGLGVLIGALVRR